MVTINEVGKAFSQSLAAATPKEAARYFTELEWQIAEEVGAGRITSEDGDARMVQINAEIGEYLNNRNHSDFHTFNAEYHQIVFKQMFRAWTLDSLKYINHVMVVSQAVDLLKQIIEDDWELSDQRRAVLSRIFDHIAEIRRIDLEAQNTILADAPWEKFGMTRPEIPGGQA